MEEQIRRIKEKTLTKGLKLNPTISTADLESLENKYGISLPEEYKAFITLIGDGGDGPPYYGLFCVQRAIETTIDFAGGKEIVLASEFPFKEYWVWEDEEKNEVYGDKIKQVGYGNLILGDEGCGQYWSLIITGSERGQIWNFTDVGIQPCAPRLSFLDWYEYWLDGGNDWWREFY